MFFTLTIANVEDVGLSCDESAIGLFGVYLLKNRDTHLISQVEINFLNTKFPVNNLQPYNFALADYMLIPFLFTFGMNILAFKMLPIFITWLTILMLYYVLKNLFNRRIAIITSILLVVSPVFIHFTRRGLYVTEPLLNFFFIASIFFYLLYTKRKNNFYLCLSALSFGFGFSVYISFFSRLIGLLVAGLIIFPKKLFNLKTVFRIGQLILIIVFFATGSFLFIYYNIVTRGETFRLARNIITDQETEGGVNNLDFVNNFKLRMNHLTSIIEEDMHTGHFLGKYTDMVNKARLIIDRNIHHYIFRLALILNLIFLLFKRKIHDYKKVVFIYIFYITMFLTSCFSAWSMQPVHLGLIYPFPQFALALFVDNLIDVVSNTGKFRRTFNALIYVLVLVPVIIINFNILFLYHSIYRKTGGYNTQSRFVYDLVDYIKKNNIYPIFPLDWGLNHTLPFITQGEIYVIQNCDLCEEAPQEIVMKTAKRILKNNKTVYLVDIWDRPSKKVKWIKELSKELNKDLTLVKSFVNKVNDPVYIIYKVEQERG